MMKKLQSSLVALWLLGLCAAIHWVGPARAGGFTPCDAPFVFEGSAANIVPIEFFATASDARTATSRRLEELQDAAQHMAWLFKLDSWHQPTYGSLGVVTHMFLGRKCPPDEVLEGILRGGIGAPMPPGQILLVLQGRIYIERGNILLQSRLRGYRRNKRSYGDTKHLTAYFQTEYYGMQVGQSADPMRSRLPTLDITFSPRILTYDDLAQIDDVFADASRVFDQPSTDSGSQELRFERGRPFAFSVRIMKEGEWIQIEDFFSDMRGFIKTNRDASDFLHERLPELDFLNGMLGYLRLAQAQDDIHGYPPPPPGAADQARSSLDRFLKRERSQDDTEARALAHALIGIISSSDGGEWWTASRQAFIDAATLAPFNSDYRNLLGMTNSYICCNERPLGEFGDPSVNFADSLSLDPENRDSLNNLNTYLSLLDELARRDRRPEGLNFARLNERKAVVERVVTGLEASDRQ